MATAICRGVTAKRADYCVILRYKWKPDGLAPIAAAIMEHKGLSDEASKNSQSLST